MAFTTADIANNRDDVDIIGSVFADFGGVSSFEGRVRTARSEGDHGLARELLDGPGDGAVLVIDGGAGSDFALLGDDMVALGLQNGWAGIIAFGSVRDSAALSRRPFGIKALGTHPKSTPKTRSGEIDVNVSLAGATFTPGKHVWADADGIIVER